MLNLLRKAVEYFKNTEVKPLDDEDYDEMFDFVNKDLNDGFFDVTGTNPISFYHSDNYYD